MHYILNNSLKPRIPSNHNLISEMHPNKRQKLAGSQHFNNHSGTQIVTLRRGSDEKTVPSSPAGNPGSILHRWGCEIVRITCGSEAYCLVITTVCKDTPAFHAGLKAGDLVVGAFGFPLGHPRQLFRMLTIADCLEITIHRNKPNDDDTLEENFLTVSIPSCISNELRSFPKEESKEMPQTCFPNDVHQQRPIYPVSRPEIEGISPPAFDILPNTTPLLNQLTSDHERHVSINSDNSRELPQGRLPPPESDYATGRDSSPARITDANTLTQIQNKNSSAVLDAPKNSSIIPPLTKSMFATMEDNVSASFKTESIHAKVLTGKIPSEDNVIITGTDSGTLTTESTSLLSSDTLSNKGCEKEESTNAALNAETKKQNLGEQLCSTNTINNEEHDRNRFEDREKSNPIPSDIEQGDDITKISSHKNRNFVSISKKSEWNEMVQLVSIMIQKHESSIGSGAKKCLVGGSLRENHPDIFQSRDVLQEFMKRAVLKGLVQESGNGANKFISMTKDGMAAVMSASYKKMAIFKESPIPIVNLSVKARHMCSVLPFMLFVPSKNRRDEVRDTYPGNAFIHKVGNWILLLFKTKGLAQTAIRDKEWLRHSAVLIDWTKISQPLPKPVPSGRPETGFSHYGNGNRANLQNFRTHYECDNYGPSTAHRSYNDFNYCHRYDNNSNYYNSQYYTKNHPYDNTQCNQRPPSSDPRGLL